MTWFKTDDSFPSHPKVRSIPRRVRMSALGVWLACGTWSSKHLTDGVIPVDVVEDEGGRPADAKSLVTAGLWHSSGHDCPRCDQPDKGNYVFHDWLDWQPSRAEILAKRAEEAQRKAEWRAKKAEERAAKKRAESGSVPGGVPTGQAPDGQWDTYVSPDGVPGGVPTLPTRPDPYPTRPDPLLPTGEAKGVLNLTVVDGGEDQLFDAEAWRTPKTIGLVIQSMVGAYSDAVVAAGGVPTKAYKASIGRDVKRLLGDDKIDPAVLLVAVQRAGTARARVVDRYLGDAQATFDRSAQSRAAVKNAWYERARLIDESLVQDSLGA